MDPRLKLAKKKAVVTAAGLAALSGSLSMLPSMAARHGIPALWVALPLLTLEIAGFVWVMMQYNALLTLKSSLRG